MVSDIEQMAIIKLFVVIYLTGSERKLSEYRKLRHFANANGNSPILTRKYV